LGAGADPGSMGCSPSPCSQKPLTSSTQSMQVNQPNAKGWSSSVQPSKQGGINLMSTRFFQRSKTLRVLLVLLACRTLLCSPCSYTNTIKLSPPCNRFLNPPLFMSIENFHIVEDDATACQQVLQIFPQYLMFKPQIYVEPI
jgi:hypothetical protein